MQNEVYLIVKFQGKPGQQEALQSALADLQAGSVQEAGCIEYRVFKGEAPDVWHLTERWKDEAALALHQQEPHFIEGVAKLAELTEHSSVEKVTPI
jgi:quinol monooxygenase YgiN